MNPAIEPRMDHRRTPPFGRLTLTALLAATGIAFLPGCGTRVATPGSEAGLSAPAPSSGAGAASETTATGPAALATTIPGAPVASSRNLTASGRATAPAHSPDAPGSGRGDQPATDGQTAPPRVAGGAGPPGTPTVPAVPSPRSGGSAAPSPVVLASLGTQSGPVGALMKPVVRGMQIWVADVNTRGGLNGHPVRIVIYDDGGDPARHKANARDAVEQKGAIAFLANTDAISGAGTVDYITDKRIPMIGGDHARTFALKSPLFFPVAATGPNAYRSVITAPARLLIPQGKKKIGWVVCVETPICSEADRQWQTEAARLGWEPVYRAQASVTQPDYTAECLAARSAGADVMVIVLDPAGLERFARSCSRQGYHPAYVAAPGLGQADRMKDNPDLDGLIALGLTFPYFQTGTPATDDFQRAMRRFASGEEMEQGHSQGWVSGKLLEKAAAGLGEPPTSADILNGLWRFTGDTLAGMSEPLTFRQNQPPDPPGCWWTYTVAHRQWVSPDNFTRQCL